MHDRTELIENRVRRVLTERLIPAVHERVGPLTLTACHLPPGPNGTVGEPIPAAEALARNDYQPFEVGSPWGPPWGTSWFHLTGQVPAVELPAGDGYELILDLGWADHSVGFQAEGLVLRPDGSTVKGLNPRNAWVPVRSGPVDLYLEAAANPLLLEVHPFLPTPLGERQPANSVPLYRFRRAEVTIRRGEVAELVADVTAVDGVMRTLPANDPRRIEMLLALEKALDAVDLQDVAGTAAAGRAKLAAVLSRPADAGSHRVIAVGHAHIDSAWLWPVRETIRKVGRTTANVLNLLESEPDWVYAMSSAQQYAWLAEHRPDLFARVREQVAAGRFAPVGGMWVESDTNMVGGEAMVRQFLQGKAFFQREFGIDCTEVWLPDSFGYTAALPQIVALAGIDNFLTQKISWNQQNKFPHHTFLWEGIDGTRVFTHFPPVDSYSSELSPAEMSHAATNFRDKGAANLSLVPFGYGDGGGGPTREMIAAGRRTADLAGATRVAFGSPQEFFAKARADYPNPPVWVGELYLELHRGTYTSQARTKQGNRRCEHLLRAAELWCTTAAVRDGREYPYEQLTRLWQTVLLQQFHDILPGSSIAWVHREAAENYAATMAELGEIITTATASLAPGAWFNASPFAQEGIPALGAGQPAVSGRPATLSTEGTGFVLDNGLLRVRIDETGVVTGLLDLAADRQLLPPGTRANLLQLHPDFPNMWDAWDIDSFYRNTVRDLDQVDLLETFAGDGACGLIVRRSFGDSTVSQTISLRPGARQLDFVADIDWHEREKLLKVAFPVDVHTDRAAYETQFGHLYRPTHTNTSWDNARFEVCAHRWLHVGENGYGAALVNDASYGHDVTRHPGPDGSSYSVIRLSLLRAPRYPDPETDQGRHVLRYALVAGADVLDAAAAGYRINLPFAPSGGPAESSSGGVSAEVEPLVTVDGNALVEAVKLAEDRSGDVIVRLYEPAGRRGPSRVRTGFPVTAITETDLLERPLNSGAHQRELRSAMAGFEQHENGAATATLEMRPFQISTLRLHR